jgi:hypothetical protein
MKKFFLRISIIIAVLLAAYFIWSHTGRATEKETGWSKLPEFKARFEYVEVGVDSDKGNVIGIQPFLTATSYSTAFNFEVSLRFYFEQLRRENKLTDKSIVVLPEYIGTWLVAANEKEKIYKQETIEQAMTTMVRSNLFGFLYGYLKSSAKNKWKYAVFHLKAEKMAKQYQQVFSTLAKEYKCMIVAGSILLPDASTDNKGNLQIRQGAPLYNTSVVFDSNGTIIQPLVKKLFPVKDEEEFTANADSNQKSLFQTKAGKMGLLIGADSWHKQSYKHITTADFLVNPSFSDKDSIQLRSMVKQAKEVHILQGMNVFFTGSLWDMKPEGKVLIFQNDSTTVLPASVGKGRIVNLFLK